MSCLNLRLPPAKKAWKSFTSKLQSKLLHKLNKSRAIKKNSTKYRFSAKSAKPSRSIIFFEQKKRHGTLIRSGKGKSSTSITSATSHFHFPKKSTAAPVYIDKLFLEAPAIELVAKNAPIAKNVKVIVDDEPEAAPGTSSKDDEEKGGEREVGGGAADDMWESLGFASPQMRGIDERAEQFISSFRADMEHQEMIAKRFYKADGRR